MINLSKFAENLSDLIFDKGITQKQLAESTGLDAASICKYLEANRMPTVDAIIKLADYFNCSVDFLLGVNEEKSNSKFLPCPPFSERLEYFLSVYGHSGHKLCKEAGLPDSRFYHWKNGTHAPSLESVEKLAIFFKCPIDFVLGREK